MNTTVEQLTRKMEKITQIDKHLLKLYDDASELESAVLETEELLDVIMNKIARA